MWLIRRTNAAAEVRVYAHISQLSSNTDRITVIIIIVVVVVVNSSEEDD